MRAQSTGMVRRTLTNETGSFTFAQLAPDNYSGTVDYIDFHQARFSNQLADPGSSARMNFTLALALTNTVEVRAPLPSGLQCFSVFGGVKADGTPFTDADCPGGRLLIGGTPPTPPAITAPEPAPREVASVSSAAVPVNQADGARGPIRVGGDVSAGNLIFHPNPTYPSEARNKGIEGAVILSGTITTDGSLRSLKIIGSSNPQLENSVIEMIQDWKYKPTILNGTPVEVLTTITVNFTLVRFR